MLLRKDAMVDSFLIVEILCKITLIGEKYKMTDTRYRIWVDCLAISVSACTFVNKIVLRCKQSSWYAFFEDTEYGAATSAHGCINGAPPV